MTDDAAARLAAQQRGYVVHGTLGLMIRTVRRGKRTPQQVLDVLRSIRGRSTLFVKPELLKTIIERLSKEWLKED